MQLVQILTIRPIINLILLEDGIFIKEKSTEDMYFFA